VLQLVFDAMSGKSGAACIPSRILHDRGREKRRSKARRTAEYRPGRGDIAHRHAFAKDGWHILPN